MMIFTAEILALLAAGLWSGAAIYIGFCEHPAALKVGVEFATSYFRLMSRRTAPLMMVFSAVSGVAGTYIWWAGGHTGWLTGGILMLAMFPLTGLLIVPTNIKLLKIDPVEDRALAEELHRYWGRMHWLRTVVGVPAFLIFAWLAVSAH
jgi:hypothetical protein